MDKGTGLLHPEGPGMLPSGTCAGRAVAGTVGTAAEPQHPPSRALCVTWVPRAPVAMRVLPSSLMGWGPPPAPPPQRVRRDASPALPAAAPAEVKVQTHERTNGRTGKEVPRVRGRRWQGPRGGNVPVCVPCAWACVVGVPVHAGPCNACGLRLCTSVCACVSCGSQPSSWS